MGSRRTLWDKTPFPLRKSICRSMPLGLERCRRIRTQTWSKQLVAYRANTRSTTTFSSKCLKRNSTRSLVPASKFNEKFLLFPTLWRTSVFLLTANMWKSPPQYLHNTTAKWLSDKKASGWVKIPMSEPRICSFLLRIKMGEVWPLMMRLSKKIWRLAKTYMKHRKMITWTFV